MKMNCNSPYIKWGMTAFIVLCSTILFFFAIFRMKGLLGSVHLVFQILMPFVYGLVIAYLLCPVYNYCTKRIYKVSSGMLGRVKALTFSRVLSTTITMIIAFVVVGGLVSMVLPQMLESLINLVRTAPDSFKDFFAWAETKLSSNKEVNDALKMLMGDYTDKLNDWLQNEVLPWLLTFAAQVSTGLIDLMRFLKDFVIGIIICIYFLNSKEIFKAQSKKLTYAVLKKENARMLIREMNFINKTFSAFISGKLIDSAIIGVICFVAMTILHMPYIMLISVIIGVTNIIPFFGPFIGAIPSTIIILTASPIQAVYFVIFIFILQQVDGNIIGPKILGDSTGLPSFWVMFAILVGGGLFGFAGMILGIPIFAIFYAYFSRMVDSKLKKKNLPVSVDMYKDLSYYDEAGRNWLDEI
ncbi:AI-2E family transporter [Aminipila sp.]|uniref:AI-2E family transporter n=1 Tax=Aminipila sp. TaxID=2060095 RepID=UPI001DA373C4|nr:AI-2E family transporter [Aminipila sp.]MBE6034276.1 AI-2E family transporter [Clostridiales bacterium]